MKGIQRIRALMKKRFVSRITDLGFQFDLQKDIFYRQHNDMWQILQYHVSSGGFIVVYGFIILDQNDIELYRNRVIDRIQHSHNAVASQPTIHAGSIYNELMVEQTDEKILQILEELYIKIEKKLLPYLNKKTREEIQSDELKPDLSDYIRSIDIFTYFRQKYGYTPVSIKTKEELFNYKFVTMYLMCFHSVELIENIEKIYDISQNEINKIVNDNKLYQENESIINVFIQEKMNEN